MTSEADGGSTPPDRPQRPPALAVPQIALVALFVTALVTAQVTASKVVAFDLPVTLPLTGDALVVPAAVVAYALTFLASDCYVELYGRRQAQVLVNVGFVMNFVLLALIWLAIGMPVFEFSPVEQEAFGTVLGASTGIVAGSLLAYLVSQNYDVLAFHWLRERTAGRHLWLRNVVSTATSQFVDTVIFISVAFVIFQGVPPGEAIALIIGQYLVKLLIAGLDTPFVYLIVGLTRRTWPRAAPAVETD